MYDTHNCTRVAAVAYVDHEALEWTVSAYFLYPCYMCTNTQEQHTLLII